MAEQLEKKEEKLLIKDDIERIMDRVEDVEDRVGIADMLLQKVVSRKFLILVVSTVLLFFGKVNSEHWMYLSICYIGASSLAEMIKVMKGIG